MAPIVSRLQNLLNEQDDLIIIAATCLVNEKRKKRRKHRWWVHNILQKRHQQGAFYHLFPDLHLDEEKFQNYFRLTRNQFAEVLSIVESDLRKHTRNREVIGPTQSHAICLRFLTSGESFVSLGYSFRVGSTTIGKIVADVCKVLWDRLAPIHMKVPTTQEEWKLIAENFESKWQFPHCCGALDGKHVSGSLYYNYIGTFSIVLMALVDANLNFIAIDVGAFGRNSDGGIFSNSNMRKGITENQLLFPPASPIRGAEHLGNVPFVVIADEAFPLQEHVMRPFPGRGCSEDKKIYNYILSRARRIVENAFGVLAARWRIFHSKMGVCPQWVNDIVKANCVLHNILQSQSTASVVENLLHESEIACHNGLHDIQRIGNRAGVDATSIRDTFKEYFTHVAPLSWQLDHVRRGNFD